MDGPLNIRTREGRLTFGELGEEFVRLVLTTDLLTREFMAAIPPGGLEAVETVDGFDVEYRGELLNITAKRHGITRLHPRPALHGYRFHFLASFRLSLTVNIIGGLKEQFELSGTIPVTLEAQAYRPLDLYIAYEKVRPELIELQIEKVQWHNLSQRFGGLDDKVRRKVADRVNSILAGNEAQRSINLLDLIGRAVADRAKSLVGGAKPT